ncbi:MAG: hypothetical protein ABJZ55_23725 [Fuerstiella sp.]
MKSVISSSGIVVGTRPVVVGGESCTTPPRISVQRSGSTVSSIEIRCGCGELIVLECQYANPAAEPAVTS